MCRRCVADVSPMCLGHFWPWCTSRNVSPMVFGVETSGENFNACIEIFLDVPMPWRSMAITRVRRRSFAKPLVHGGAALPLGEKCEICINPIWPPNVQNTTRSFL